LKKVLLITDVDFWLQGAGHRMRISALIAYLSNNTDLYIVYIGVTTPYNLQFLNNVNYNFHALDNEHQLSPLEYGSRLEEYLRDKDIDAVIIEYIHLSYILNFVNEDVLTVLDAHDIISERSEEFKKFNHAGAIYEISAEDEMEIFGVYDHVMVLCQPDYENIGRIPGNKALLCPHPSNVYPHKPRNEVKNIAYIASEYVPNVDAINFFINNCWKAISNLHDVTLSIYGNVVHCLEPPLFKNIILKGFVANLNEVYDEADIIINPVRFGAGLKIKNIEALANGIPLVTTSHGARGLEKIQGKALLLADSSAEFIDKISSLINDYPKRESLSTSSTNFIGENFSAKKCFAPLLEVIQS
jgi:glycosyltransferase involved in cell wall biosynthesis